MGEERWTSRMVASRCLDLATRPARIVRQVRRDLPLALLDVAVAFSA